MKKKGLKLKKNAKITVAFIVSAIVFLVFVVLTLATYSTINHANVAKNLSYAYKNTLTYSGCVKENNFIESQCYSDDRSYVADLLDKLIIKYNHTISSNILVDTIYTHRFVATLTATEYNDPSHILYSKSEVLKEHKETKYKSNIDNDSDEITVDYQKYNEMIKTFKRNYSVPLSASLNIASITETEGITKEISNHVIVPSSLSINIPLGEQTVNIEKTKVEDKNSKSISIKYYPNKVSKNYTLFSVFYHTASLLGLITILIIIRLFSTRHTKPHKNKKELRRILKNYDSAIVTVKTMPYIGELNKVEVTSFLELLDAKGSLNVPILYYDDQENNVAIFLCLAPKNAYYYGINTREIKK